MNSGVVSVIVPVYNVEKYLNRCINSIINQTYKELEIILVDDGSTDNCSVLCDEWAEKDIRIKVIHKENAGLGYARNSGIEVATGEYICFFDSDDYIESETIEECYLMAKNENADIVCFGHNSILDDGSIKYVRVPSVPKKIFSKEEVVNEFLPNMLGRNPVTGENWNLELTAWSALFSAKLIKDNAFQFVSERKIISEDYYSLLGLYRYVNKVAIIAKPFYNYCDNGGSLTRIFRKDRYEKIKEFQIEFVKLCDKLEYPGVVKERIWYPYFGNLIGHIKQLVNSNESFFYKYSELKKIVDDDYFQSSMEQSDFSTMSIKIRLLFLAMKYRKTMLTYIILKLRNLKGKSRK